MTMYTTDQIAVLKDNMEGEIIDNFYYEKDGDYFVIETGAGEFCFRFMADIERAKPDNQ